MTSSRFSYVKYDDDTTTRQNDFKMEFEELEKMVAELQDGRAKSLVLTKLEEAYMWVGKALRDEQLQRNKNTVEQPERKDG